MATTFTITSVDTPGWATLALTSRVTEPLSSAFDHVAEMARLYPDIVPHVQVSARCWRWTWEGVTPAGHRWSDTVRVV